MNTDGVKESRTRKPTACNKFLQPIELNTEKLYIGKTVEYDLYVRDSMVNFTGKHRHAIAINGQIPAPILEFTEGDTAIIRVHNQMKMETSIHWHGILLPNKEDGVPYLTTSPVEAGETYTFTFPLIQSGTYWYHSHTMLQEALEFEGRVSWKGDFETETHLLRYLDKKQFLAFYVGYDYRQNKTRPLFEKTNSKDNRHVFDAGFYYLLPLLIRSEWRVDNTGRLRLQLERNDLPLSNNLFFDGRINTDKEFTVSFRYMVSKYFSISTNYDSDYKWGAGLTLHY